MSTGRYVRFRVESCPLGGQTSTANVRRAAAPVFGDRRLSLAELIRYPANVRAHDPDLAE